MDRFNIGDTVYLRTDPAQDEYIVVEIMRLENSGGVRVTYMISGDGSAFWVYGIEISHEADEMKKLEHKERY